MACRLDMACRTSGGLNQGTDVHLFLKLKVDLDSADAQGRTRTSTQQVQLSGDVRVVVAQVRWPERER